MTPSVGQPLRDAGADTPQVTGRALAHDLEPGVAGEPEGAARLAELGRDLGAHLGVADAHGAVQVGGGEHVGLDPARHGLGVVGLDADEGLVPAEHLHHRAGHGPQRVHDDGGCRVVGRLVDGQHDGVRAAAHGGAQRHPRPDAELAGLVGGRRDDAALGRVAPCRRR